jgi:LacI family transcriptional regulator
MNKEITIYDIAKELDISAATVSRALNDHPTVNKNTKQRIHAAASQMGYRSNTFASSLRRQSTNTIGVIVPKLNSHVMSSVIAGMEKIANEEGYNLIISQSLETVQKEITNAKTMYSSRIDGLLVSLAFDTEDIGHFEPFINKGIPVLFYDRVMDHRQCGSIVIDNLQAGYKATAHMVEQGCRHIVHVTGNLKRNVYADRLKGYKYALLDHNLPFKESNILVTTLSEEAGVEAAQQILRMDPLPDGVFVTNDTCAASLMKVLKQAGLSVPADIVLVGFNNDPVSRVVEPPLTTIDYPGYEMGEVAVRSLLHLISGQSDARVPKAITLRSELVVRESSLKKAAVLPDLA